MALNWKKWLGIDFEHLVDIGVEEEDDRRKPIYSVRYHSDGTPRVIREETIAAARAENEARAVNVPVHVLASLANPGKRERVSERVLETSDALGGRSLASKVAPLMSALPFVAATGVVGLAGRKVLQRLRVEREEPLWALKDLKDKLTREGPTRFSILVQLGSLKPCSLALCQDLESYGDSPLLRLLPEEVLLAVTSKLGIADRLRLASTCRKLYHISQLPSVWASVDLSGSGSAVTRISDRELMRLIRRSCGSADDDVSREAPKLKSKTWREEKLKEEAVTAQPAVQAGAQQNALPAGIILASVNQLRNQQSQEQTQNGAQQDAPVIDSTWKVGSAVEEDTSSLSRGDAISTTFPLKYLDIQGCSQISRDCLTSIIEQSASSLRQIKTSGACFLDRRGLDLLVQYRIVAEVDVELVEPNKVEWRMLLMNMRGEKDQDLKIKKLLLKDAPLMRIGSAGKALFQMAILHNMHLTELHLDRCVLRPSEALTVLEAVQHNIGLKALRICKAAEGVFENVGAVHSALTTLLQENTTLQTLGIEDSRVDDECVTAIINGVGASGTLTSLGLSRISVPAFEQVCGSLGPGGALASIQELRLTGSKLPCRTLLQHIPVFQNSSRGVRNLEVDVNTSCEGQCVSTLSKALDRNPKLHHLRLTVHFKEMTRASAAALLGLLRRHGKRVTVQIQARQGYEVIASQDLRRVAIGRLYKDSRPRLLFAFFALACAKLTFAAGG